MNSSSNLQKSILTFNVFFKDDTTTQSFLSSIVAKEPEHWARLRKVLADQGDCRLTWQLCSASSWKSSCMFK